MQASTITIAEVNGQGRSLVLTGAGLPKRGAKWGSETRLKTSFPNGNPSAVQHVLGSIEAPTEFEGVWRTTLLQSTPVQYFDENGNGNELTDAFDVWQALDVIRLAGFLVTVTWVDSVGRQILRRGRIGVCEPDFDRFDDIRWKATFHWVDRGSTPGTVTLSSDEGVSTDMDSLIAALNDIALEISEDALQALEPDNLLSAGFSFSLGFGLESLGSFSLAPLVSVNVDTSSPFGFGFGSTTNFGVSVNIGYGAGIAGSAAFSGAFLEGVTSSIRVSVSELTDAATAAKNFNAISPELARVASQTARRAQQQLAATEKLMTQVPPELLSAIPRPSAICRASTYVGNVTRKVQTAEAAAIKLVRSSKQRMSVAKNKNGTTSDHATANETVKVHLAKQTETFASISLRYYRTPDRAAVIAKANGFASYRISPPAGTKLLIPHLNATNATGKTQASA